MSELNLIELPSQPSLHHPHPHESRFYYPSGIFYGKSQSYPIALLKREPQSHLCAENLGDMDKQ